MKTQVCKILKNFLITFIKVDGGSTNNFMLFVVLTFAIATMGTGCSGVSRLGEGQRLYAGATIHISKADKEWSTKILKPDLEKVLILPRPNRKLLWMRPKLSIYNTFHNDREKSLGNFIANQFGEAPVLYGAKIAPHQSDLLKERAGNDGYFKIRVSHTEKLNNHTARLSYEVQVNSSREMVDHVAYPSDSSKLTQTLQTLQPGSLVKPDKPYQLETLIAERQRLSDTLRNHGWYYFSPDNLIFEADTLHTAGALDLKLLVKKEVGETERRQYRIASITVYPDYDLAKKTRSEEQQNDTLRYECISYVYQDMSVKPELLNEKILLKCGEYYSNNDYQATIYRLLNLNIYKFINIRFEVASQSDSLLDVSIYLTPYRPERVEATLSGVFSPGFYYGLRAGGSYTHRNLFKGAESLRLGLNGAYLLTDKDNFDFVDFLVSDISAGLTFPRLLFLPERNRLAFSTTQLNLRHETNLFKYDLPVLGRFRLSFQRVIAEGGYLWKKNRRGSFAQEFNPLSLGLQFATLSNQEIRQALIANISNDTTGTSLSLLTFLEYKPNYTITLDQRLEPARQHTVYFRLRFAGQASGYIRSRYLPGEYSLNRPLNLFVETDYRQYQKTNRRDVLALRIAAGAGIPLRSNGTIALLDRFVIGGASSVRAFAPRTVGPGSQPRDTTATSIGVGNYTGNVLIEGSMEYRMPIGRYPELAVFLDAGNVWLTSGPEATEASDFKLNKFYKELAIGAGVGLRVNLGFFVLRLDVAFPLTKPFLPEGQRWVADDLHFANGAWRNENLNWNFSFGYPF